MTDETPELLPLSEEQAEIFNRIAGRSNPFFVLMGEGGAGKTFTIARLPTLGRPVVYCAPTHAAKNVLLRELERNGVQSPVVKTVASLVGKVADRSSPPPDDDILAAKFVYAGTARAFEPDTILVVDESSQVSLPDAQRLATMNAEGTTIFVGDDHQLAPPKGVPIWDWLRQLFQTKLVGFKLLTKNFRAERPDLNDVINHVRRTGDLPADMGAHAVLYHDYDTWFAEQYRHMQEDETCVVSVHYRNDTVNNHVERIRRERGYKPGEAAVGEILRLNEDYPLLDWHEEFARLKRRAGIGCRPMTQAEEDDLREQCFKQASQNVRETMAHNGDLVEVIYACGPAKSGPAWAKTRATSQYVKLRMLDGEYEGEEFFANIAELGKWSADGSELRVLMKECRDMIERIQRGERGTTPQILAAVDALTRGGKGNPFAPSRLWGVLFHGVRQEFLRVQPAAAMTIHKAQGSGWEYVFVDWRDIRAYGAEDPEEAGTTVERLRYTAVSRARRELHILLPQETTKGEW